MGAIFKREFKAYFSSPLGYIFLAVMYLFSGSFFSYLLSQASSQIEYVFGQMFTIVMIVIPILTMRLMSEDKKIKTDQLLLTSPVNVSGIVMGKYLAAFTMYLIGIASTLVYVVVLATFTTPDWNIFLGNFLSIALLGAALIAIGLLISSLTESQMVAALVTFGIMLAIMSFDVFAQAIPTTFQSTAFYIPVLEFLAKCLKSILTGLSFISRYNDFISGVLDVSHIIFFLSLTAGFLFLTVRVLERKRWS